MSKNAQSSSQVFAEIWPYLLVMAIFVIVGGVAIMLIRRMITQKSSAQNVGFTLEDLRTMRASGELSEEEFQKAREQMIGRMRKVEETPSSQPIKPDSKPNNPQTGTSGET
ncbi:MAG TPA: SHOCT domain-containing protein [Phycisphaerales bacterium]|nr:SHOCT domain-containing protein [Phycisphaerales bacterium]